MKRRTFLKIAGAGVAAPYVVTAARAQSGLDWQQFSGRTINVLMARHPWQEAISPLLGEFEELTGITVRLTTLPEGQYGASVVAELTGGVFGHDVFMTEYYDAPTYQQNGWTRDLAEFLDNPALTDAEAYDWEDFFPAARDVADIGGRYTDRVAITAEAQVLIYRTDVLEALGLEVPTDFDELIATAAAISEAGEHFGMTLRGAGGNWWPLYGFVRSFGGEYVDADLTPLIGSDEAKAALDAYGRAAAYCPPGITSYDWDEINTAMLSGQSAMFLDSSVIYSRLQDPEASTVVGRVGAAPFVSGPAGRHGHSHFWTISLADAAREPEAGWLFVQWATSKDVQARLSRQGLLAPRASVAEMEGVSEAYTEDFLTAVQTTLESAVISPANPYFFELMDPLRARVQDTILGNIEAGAALDEVQAEWERILAG